VNRANDLGCQQRISRKDACQRRASYFAPPQTHGCVEDLVAAFEIFHARTAHSELDALVRDPDFRHDSSFIEFLAESPDTAQFAQVARFRDCLSIRCDELRNRGRKPTRRKSPRDQRGTRRQGARAARGANRTRR
jgi:hypothetical protein